MTYIVIFVCMIVFWQLKVQRRSPRRPISAGTAQAYATRPPEGNTDANLGLTANTDINFALYPVEAVRPSMGHTTASAPNVAPPAKFGAFYRSVYGPGVCSPR